MELVRNIALYKTIKGTDAKLVFFIGKAIKTPIKIESTPVNVYSA